MTDTERKEIEQIIAQLRHAYMHLNAERVTKQKVLADGLISPQIKRLERLLNDRG